MDVSLTPYWKCTIEMDFFSDIASYDFLQRALLASLVTGVVCGIVGVYMVVRRMVFLAGGVTHGAFGGLGVAYFLGINTLWGALAAGLVSALAISRSRIREDSAIGIMWSVGMAIGIIFILLTPGYAPNLMSFLFGNILMVAWTDVVLLFALLTILLSVMAIWGRKIVYVALDSEFALSQHLPVRFLNGIMLCLLSLAIILSIKVVGIMLLIALLTIPAVISATICDNYRTITIVSSLISVAGLVAGIVVSYSLDVPSSAVTVVILVLVLILVRAIKAVLKLKAK